MKLVVGVCGASGSAYARRLLTLLTRRCQEDSALHVDWVASHTAPKVWKAELGETMPDSLPGLRRWDVHDFDAPFASGSNAPDAVLLVPCSMSRLAEVAHGTGKDLLSRSCDVALKERRRLILMVRESPLSLVHLRNMVSATEAGAIVLPASPSFYAGIRNLDQALDSVLMRALDLVGLPMPLVDRWVGSKDSREEGS